MITLLFVESRRYLARRLVRVLVTLALVVIGLVAGVVFAVNEPLSHGSARFAATDDPRFLVSLWPRHAENEGLLMFAAVFVPLFAFVAGASMVGAEWRAGSIATQLTWEPRRAMVLTAKLLAAGLVAAVIGALLTALFLGAFLPTVLVKGSTAGVDADWWLNAVGGWLRIAGLTGLTAVVGAALAALGRSTAGAIGLGLAWITAGEGLVRVLWFSERRWLVGENSTAFIVGETATFDVGRTVAAGGITLAAYALAVSVVAIVLFHRRDVVVAAP